jgi:hypothetical protein
MNVFLDDGYINFNFEDPIIVADAKMEDLRMLFDNDKRRKVGPTNFYPKNIEFQLRLLRLRNMKSCCYCFYDSNSKPGWRKQFQCMSVGLRPLDLSLDPSNWGDGDIDRLDFERDVQKGFGTICNMSYAEESLPLQVLNYDTTLVLIHLSHYLICYGMIKS